MQSTSFIPSVLIFGNNENIYIHVLGHCKVLFVSVQLFTPVYLNMFPLVGFDPMLTVVMSLSQLNHLVLYFFFHFRVTVT